MPQISQRAVQMPASPIRKLVPLAEAAAARGTKIYHLNIGQPDLPTPEVGLQALKHIDRKVLEYSPSDGYRSLREKLVSYYEQYQIKLTPDEIIVTAGGSEAVLFAFMTCLNPGDEIIVPEPAYANYMAFAVSAGAVIRPVVSTIDNGFALPPVEEFERLINSRTRGILICNPNNPTGRVEPRDKIIRIARSLEDMGVLLFLDETLLELVPGYTDITLSGMVDRFSNLVVASSLTKSFAIPGIRIGFGLSNPDIISEMEKVRMTWNVGQIEQTVATVLLRDKMDYVDHAAAVMAEESEIMNSSLEEIGFPAGPVSDSFFYFNSLEPLGMDAADFNKRMLRHGIMVRDCSSFGEDFRGYVRYSVKDRERNCRFIAAVDAVING